MAKTTSPHSEVARTLVGLALFVLQMFAAALLGWLGYRSLVKGETFAAMWDFALAARLAVEKWDS